MLVFASLTILLCLLLSAIGLPISLALIGRRAAPRDWAWILLAPAFGATLYFSLGVDLHFVGLPSELTITLLTGVSIGASVFFIRRNRLPARGVALALSAVAIAAGAALSSNIADVSYAGIDYFPLTNDDTFSYLGLIDQIRTSGWITPPISYPAGYFPLIEHAIATRAPGAILASDFADVFRLDAHSAFFIVQRLTHPVVALGSAAIVLIVTGSIWAGGLCFCSLVFGNALLHQILQQFNSSAMGLIVGVTATAVGLWTVRVERTRREAIAGHAMTGFAIGSMAITSMEAHPFYLCVFGAVFLATTLRHRAWLNSAWYVLAFAAAYVLSSIPFLLQIWPALISQYIGATGRTDGAIAVPGFIMFAMGVGHQILPSLLNYRPIPIMTAIGVAAVLVLAIMWIGWQAMKPRQNRILQTDAVFLFMIASIPLVLQIYLYSGGVGYGLLKLTDYFAFTGAVVISVSAASLSFMYGRQYMRVATGLVVVFCVVAVSEKRSILRLYYEQTARMPLPAAYQLDPAITSTVLDPSAFSMEMLNLFLYENRAGTTRISFEPVKSNRYRPTTPKSAAN